MNSKKTIRRSGEKAYGISNLLYEYPMVIEKIDCKCTAMSDETLKNKEIELNDKQKMSFITKDNIKSSFSFKMTSENDQPLYNSVIYPDENQNGTLKQNQTAYVGENLPSIKKNSSNNTEIDKNSEEQTDCSAKDKKIVDEKNNSEKKNKKLKETAGKHGEHSFSQCDFTYYFINISKIHGSGLFASKLIPSGYMIIEYKGMKIGDLMADKLEQEYKRNNIDSVYMFRIGKDLIVDATVYGNHARFINHSCDPNAEARIVSCNGERKLFIFAIKDIHKNQEITMLYNLYTDEKYEALKCNCGHANCRKTM